MVLGQVATFVDRCRLRRRRLDAAVAAPEGPAGPGDSRRRHGDHLPLLRRGRVEDAKVPPAAATTTTTAAPAQQAWS